VDAGEIKRGIRERGRGEKGKRGKVKGKI